MGCAPDRGSRGGGADAPVHDAAVGAGVSTDVQREVHFDERTPVTPDPTRQPFAGAHGDLADDVFFGTRREPAAEHVTLLVVEEEGGTRTARESSAWRRWSPSTPTRRGWCPSRARARTARRSRGARA